MSIENNPEESPLERRKQALEKRKASLEAAVEKAREIRVKWESSYAEHGEINLIMAGLYQKAKQLAEEDRIKSAKMPETEEEWGEWEARTKRIEHIHEMIDNLLADQGKIEQQMAALESEFEALAEETEAE